MLLTPHVIKNQREARMITGDYVDNITESGGLRGGLRKEELLKGGVQIKRGLGEAGGAETPYGDNPPDVIVPLPGTLPEPANIKP